jgi:hypothetical protein
MLSFKINYLPGWNLSGASGRYTSVSWELINVAESAGINILSSRTLEVSLMSPYSSKGPVSCVIHRGPARKAYLTEMLSGVLTWIWASFGVCTHHANVPPTKGLACLNKWLTSNTPNWVTPVGPRSPAQDEVSWSNTVLTVIDLGSGKVWHTSWNCHPHNPSFILALLSSPLCAKDHQDGLAWCWTHSADRVWEPHVWCLALLDMVLVHFSALVEWTLGTKAQSHSYPVPSWMLVL